MVNGSGPLENMDMTSKEFWRGRRVLITGHTGFKGAWLAFLLAERGASVFGFALPPEEPLSLYQQLHIEDRVASVCADINDGDRLRGLMAQARPEVIFHLAAQSLVRRSYGDPVETFATNLLGTVQLLQAARSSAVRSIVVVTSDKAYENCGWPWGYRETDRLGGHDPYSASKAAAEIAVSSMRRSYFAPYSANGHPARLATVRAGNVIGGGDWAADRLVPDIIRSCLGGNGTVELRNPTSVRPWQHVFDPLAFYVDVAERLFTRPDGVDDSWNIGPEPSDIHSVQEVANTLIEHLGTGRLAVRPARNDPHEASFLALDCSKARNLLGWRPRWNFTEAMKHTAEWYLSYHRGANLIDVSRAQIAAFEQRIAEFARSPSPQDLGLN